MARLPKKEAVRASGRRYTGAARLPPETRPITRRPTLPGEREWSDLTRRWWADLWDSPISGEYLRSDLGGLFILATLMDEFFLMPSKALASEIRLIESQYGLNPRARRSLEWQVTRVEDVREKTEARRIGRAKIIDDPRESLGKGD